MERDELADSAYSRCIIKSFKHDGSLHRVWMKNWEIPADRLHPGIDSEAAAVFLNDHTPIRESDGKEWISRVPAVSFFIPGEWFNIVALLEEKGVRYYCNLASPYYRYGDVLTYIDYDLDVVLLPDGTVQELDRDEFAKHKLEYRYGDNVQAHVEEGLARLRSRIETRAFPFDDGMVRSYYEAWKRETTRKGVVE